MSCTIPGLDSVQIKVAWTSPPMSAAPDYDDIALPGEARFSGIRINRGRSYETEQFEAGSMELLALNDDRFFEAFCTLSPYYPNVKPRRKIQFVVVRDNIEYPLFTGFTRHIRNTYPNFGTDARASLPATDGFLALSKARLTMNFETEETSGVRIRKILDAANWPGTGLMTSPGHRLLDTGNSTLQVQDVKDQSALEAIYHAELSEFGRFFIASNGEARYIERRAFYLQDHFSQVQGTFGDNPDGSEFFYQDIGFDFDDDRIHNMVTASRIGGQPVMVQDQASIDEYFETVEPVPELLLLTDNEVFDYAYYRLNREKLPLVRVQPITINPQSDPVSLWPLVLMDTLQCRYRVRKRPPPGFGHIREVEVHVEGVSYDISFERGTFYVTYQLSVADPSRPWIMEGINPNTGVGYALDFDTFYGF